MQLLDGLKCNVYSELRMASTQYNSAVYSGSALESKAVVPAAWKLPFEGQLVSHFKLSQQAVSPTPAVIALALGQIV